jgi:hypothetical protein
MKYNAELMVKQNIVLSIAILVTITFSGCYGPFVNPNEVWIVEDSNIAIDSDDNLHIIWTTYGSKSSTIHYTKLDNSGEILIKDKELLPRAGSDNDPDSPRLIIDSMDNLHIMWRISESLGKINDRYLYQGNINYLKLDINGKTLIKEKTLISGDKDGLNNPTGFDFALDSKNNLHVIIFIDTDRDVDTGEDVYYLKLDNNGNELIPKNLIIEYTSPSTWKEPIGYLGSLVSMQMDYESYNTFVHPSIAIDSKDNLHVIGMGKYTKYDDKNQQWSDTIPFINGHNLILGQNGSIYLYIDYSSDYKNWVTKYDSLKDVTSFNYSVNADEISVVEDYPIIIDNSTYLFLIDNIVIDSDNNFHIAEDVEEFDDRKFDSENYYWIYYKKLDYFFRFK